MFMSRSHRLLLQTLRCIATKTFRIGVQRLWMSADGRYYVSIDNTTYSSVVEIPTANVQKWLTVLNPHGGNRDPVFSGNNPT